MQSMHKRVFVAFLIGCAPFAMADIGELVVDLPAEVEWTMVIDEATARTYHRAWIPAGTTVEDTELWLIVSQKFDLEKRRSARRFLIDLRKRARTACTDILYNGPEKIVLEKHPLDKYHLDGVPKKFVEKYRSYWGRFFCAKQHGREYGTVTEQRVFAHRNTVFVVTSELRIPPSIYAGVFPFDTRDDVAAFWKRMVAAAHVVRDGVRIIPAP